MVCVVEVLVMIQYSVLLVGTECMGGVVVLGVACAE